MIVTIKTLQQKTFKVEIDQTENVASLKMKIEEMQGPALPATSLKLIYAGKILVDDCPLSDYNIQESNFVVVMVSKGKTASKTTSTTSTATASTLQQETSTSGATSATTQESTDTREPEPQTQPPAPAPSSSAATTVPSTSTSTTTTTTTQSVSASVTPSSGPDVPTAAEGQSLSLQDASAMLVQGEEFERIVHEYMAMGFSRDIVVRSLHASYNNPDRAMDYIMNPETLPEEFRSGAEPRPNVPGGQQPLGQPLGQPLSQAGQQFIVPGAQGQAQPQPAMMLAPHLLQQAMGAAQPHLPPAPSQGQAGNLATGGQQQQQQQQQPGQRQRNPFEALRSQPQFQTMRRLIRENPALLQSVLQQMSLSNPQLLQRISSNQQAFIDLINEPDPPAEPPSLGQQGTQPAPMVTIEVSPQDKEAIDRIKAFGFSEVDAIQAYFAFEKNEALAVDFLFNQREEGDDA